MDMLLVTLMGRKSLEHFLRNNCNKDQKSLEFKKVSKRKGDKLYVEWKGYDNWFNSCIDKKYSINE